MQPFFEFRQDRVRGDARDFSGEQLPPPQVCMGIRGGESSVESLLPGSGSVVELGWPGGSQVARVDLGGGTPQLHVSDQLGWNESVPDGGPGRRFTFGVAADMLGELSNQA